jgi:hypothetical protein
MASKYDALAEYLSRQPGPTYAMSFDTIEQVLGESLPASARAHEAWWRGKPSEAARHVQATHGWHAAGWIVEDVTLKEGNVRFRRATL